MGENNLERSTPPISSGFEHRAVCIPPASSLPKMNDSQHVPTSTLGHPKTLGVPSALRAQPATGLPTYLLIRLRSQLEEERNARISLQAALEEMQCSTAGLQQRIAALSTRRERRDTLDTESAQALRRELAEQVSRSHELERLLAIAEKAREEQLERLERADRKVQSAEKGAADQKVEFDQTLLRLQHSLTSTAQALISSNKKNELLSQEIFALKIALNESESEQLEMRNAHSRAESAENALSRMRKEHGILSSELDAVRSAAVSDDERSKMREENQLLKAELDAVRSAALAEKLTTQEYVEALKRDLDDLRIVRDEREHLMMLAEDKIAAMQAEGAALATLIDVVQASHFWKIKRIAKKMVARLLRRT